MKYIIDADEVIIGEGVVIQDGVTITGYGGNRCKRVVLGDYCFIGQNTRIMVEEFMLGDYSKLHSDSFGYGKKALRIGRNCWIGSNTTLDSEGGLDIDDNVGIGAYSQLWTHIQFGDVVEGCRFYSNSYMHVGKDAWFVGHCIVSPIKIGERSMALVGSVITKDMVANHIYGGSPAKDLTSKVGFQFEVKSLAEKSAKLQEFINKFEIKYPEHQNKIKAITSEEELNSKISCFDVSNRTYTKIGCGAHVTFLKEYTPIIKFTPRGLGSFIHG